MSADFWAGYISGAAGIIIGNPLDLIKTRLQAGDTTVHATSAASLRTTFDQAGTLVRGMLPHPHYTHLQT
jgi:solute carrier family 25 carnitine/acylcarnitine transporter 20/29